MTRHRTLSALLLFLLFALLAAAAVAAAPASSTGPVPPSITGNLPAPGAAASDAALLEAIKAPALSPLDPTPLRIIPTCPVACNPLTCHYPHSCRPILHGCPPVCV